MSGLPGSIGFHQEINGFARVIKGYEEKIAMYEKIIAEMAEEISGCAEIGIYCDGCQYFEGENEDCEATSSIECRAHIVKYYKQRAGIEGEHHE